MAKKKNSVLFRLKELVDSLDGTEKRYFKRYVKSGKSSDEKYLLLFDQLQKAKADLNENMFYSLSGGSKSKLTATARYLEQLIFESLAFYKGDGISGLQIYIAAKQKGFLSYAKKVLNEEIEKASQRDDYCYLGKLWEEAHTLKKTYGIEVDVLGPPNSRMVIGYSAALNEVELQASMRKMYWKMKPALGLQAAERLLAYRSLKPKINSLPTQFSSLESTTLYKKLLVRWLTLGNKIEEAANHHFDLVDLIDRNPTEYSFEQSVESYSLAISFLTYKGSLAEAQTRLFKLGMLETGNDIEDQVLRKEWTKKALFIAVSGGFVDTGKRALKELMDQEILGLLSSRWKVILFYQAAMLCFIDQDHDLVLQWIRRITKYNSSFWGSLSWAMTVLKTISLISMGRISDGRSSLANLNCGGSKYLVEIHHLLDQWISSKEEYSGPFPFSQFLNNFLHLESMVIDDHNMDVLNMVPWIKSQIRNRPLWEIIQDENQSIYRVKAM